MAVKYLVRRFQASEPGGYYIYVLACYIQYADFSEKEREQCLCIHNKFICIVWSQSWFISHWQWQDDGTERRDLNDDNDIMLYRKR